MIDDYISVRLTVYFFDLNLMIFYLALTTTVLVLLLTIETKDNETVYHK